MIKALFTINPKQQLQIRQTRHEQLNHLQPRWFDYQGLSLRDMLWTQNSSCVSIWILLYSKWVLWVRHVVFQFSSMLKINAVFCKNPDGALKTVQHTSPGIKQAVQLVPGSSQRQYSIRNNTNRGNPQPIRHTSPPQCQICPPHLTQTE